MIEIHNHVIWDLNALSSQISVLPYGTEVWDLWKTSIIVHDQESRSDGWEDPDVEIGLNGAFCKCLTSALHTQHSIHELMIALLNIN